jgi:hypothetical protein
MMAEERREALACGGCEVGQEWGVGEQGEKKERKCGLG